MAYISLHEENVSDEVEGRIQEDIRDLNRLSLKAEKNGWFYLADPTKYNGNCCFGEARLLVFYGGKIHYTDGQVIGRFQCGVPKLTEPEIQAIEKESKKFSVTLPFDMLKKLKELDSITTAK